MSLPNPGMAFTPFDPLPASELNDMVENIEALADGTGADNNSVTASKLATNAITLASATVTSNQTFSGGAIGVDTPLTGFSITPTIPAGGRRVKVTLFLPFVGCTGPSNVLIKLWTGSVGGTQVSSAITKIQDSGDKKFISIPFTHTPSAGAITYIASLETDTNNCTVTMSATSPGQMFAEAV